ncbi:septal ring lytic transglycosylase RlpA family protein [Aquabacterium sp. A7-Y]|uniref:septal ring lytic transglycosylase RlpA family protein n=1 Tax=Aquabacterium sp. A7-Y TaxID=1349605 RepID=UPI00223CD026|nr:septal ring lytic transglycosylase RlpA family protein [Aquabacterium sp. A7-Y]MCW7540016.1 septal ring lytic transglycosylase RlpA family protein [Aquabacterium sp. A7-Y]
MFELPAPLPRLAAGLLCAALLALAGCASGPSSPRRPDVDGPGPAPAGEARDTPDAEPRVEPLARGANRPYTVMGRDYVPVLGDKSYRQRGIASWYGRKFHGRRTSSGEVYDMYAMTAAHPTLPIPSYARVRHLGSGREVVVRINDRGPFHGNRIIDLSYAAARKLGIVLRGSAEVEVERLTNDEIRAGTWRRGSPAAADTRVARSGADAPAQPATDPEPAVPTAVPVPTPSSPPAAVPETPPAAEAAVAVPVAETRAAPAAAQGYWVQLGAFRQREGAEHFQRRVSGELDWLGPLLAVIEDAPLFRLQAGPYATRGEAATAALRLRDALQLVPVITERR